jgi:predicted metal-dependent phosphoesterase TrpH
MFVDLLGKTRVKLGLHMHTTLSDGRKTPEEVARIYRDEAYDAIAITDHWNFCQEGEIEGLKIISGCEYDVGGNNGADGVYHIVGIGMTSDPKIPIAWKNMIRTSEAKAAEIMNKIHLYNGFALLAHPAWSLNTPEKMLEIGDFDGVEIYNSVSDFGMSDRAYSGLT